MLFAIMGEDERIRKLQAAAEKNAAAVAAAINERKHLDNKIENLRVAGRGIDRKLDNARQKRAFLSTQNAAEAVSPQRTALVQEALNQILLSVDSALQREASLVVEYFRSVAPLASSSPGPNHDVDLSDCETVPELDEDMPQAGASEANAAADNGAQVSPPRPPYSTSPGAMLLPVMPEKFPEKVEDARNLVEALRRQRIRAVCATFVQAHDPSSIPPLTGPQVADRFDRALRLALDNLAAVEGRAKHAQSGSAVPATSLRPAASDATDVIAVVASADGGSANGVTAAMGGSSGGGSSSSSANRQAEVEICSNACPPPTADQMLDEQLRQQQHDDQHGSQASLDWQPEQGGRRRKKTRWETPSGDPLCVALPEQQPMVDQCPACGTGPLPEAAMVGFCQCCAAVCGECSLGGMQEVNSCLYCAEHEQCDKQRAYMQFLENGDAMDETVPADLPQPAQACTDGAELALVVAGSASGKSPSGAHRSSPY